MESRDKNSNWIAVTAGFLPEKFELAASRIERDLIGLYPFRKIINFATKDLEKCAPQTLARFRPYLQEGVPGFGYYSWKPEIINQVLNGNFGLCDGVVWIDGGCEIFNTPWTRKKFEGQIQLAEKKGYLVFDLNLPENRYSKVDVIEHFPSISKSDISGQVQATHFFLHGNIGREIARKWQEVGLRDIRMFDHTPSLNGDSNEFILHKSDQSLFSLTIKSLNAKARMITPPAGNRGFLSRISAMRAPIWTSRNRSGESIKDPINKFVERITK